jgi:hypothetical protein
MTDVPTPPGSEPAVATGTAVGGTAVGYPVQVEAEQQAEYSRFLPLIKWLLLLPHYVALFFLGIGAMVVAFIAFFATLFTGRYPRGMWDYMVGVQRWSLRILAYHQLITDKYPPFTLEEQPDDTVRLRAEYPETVERWRPLLTWLLVIPYAIVAYLILIVANICSIIAFFTILFTKKIPEGVFDVIRIAYVWQIRAGFYMYWMSTEYPPFEWDES